MYKNLKTINLKYNFSTFLKKSFTKDLILKKRQYSTLTQIKTSLSGPGMFIFADVCASTEF